MSPIKDVNHFLHDCRSAYLRSAPRVTGTLLSAGCAGTWYFNWITEKTGHKSRHIGLEFFSPKPDGLPPNVEWMPNTVGDMNGVADGECEMVFSGQNLEHLWPEDVAGFFRESWRVLKPGGWLIVDSPNRLMTGPLKWSHPEHTVEYTPSEAVIAANLAGFDVSAMKGIWLCRDPQSNRFLEFDPNNSDETFPMAERCLSAIDDVDNSFIWWMEARKADRAPDVEGLVAHTELVFERAWPERAGRFSSMIPQTDDATFRSAAGQTGVVVYGPYIPLRAGKHSAAFHLLSTQNPIDDTVARIDVFADGREFASREIRHSEIVGTGGDFLLEFEFEKMEFSVEARCFSHGKTDIECRRPLIT